MDEQLQMQVHSKLEMELRVLEEPIQINKTLEEQQQWQQREETRTEKPVYGAPPQEARKFGGTYVSKLKEEDRTRTKSDLQRLHIKTRLAGIAKDYRAAAGDDADFSAILDKVDAYTQIDRTAVSSGTIDISYIIDSEGNAYNAILDAIKAYVEKMIPKIEQETATEQEKAHLNQAYRIFGFFQDQKNGYLPKPPSDARVIDATRQTIKTGAAAIDCDVKNAPLFPHEPCVNDIAQRALGDCYLLAGLASIVTQNPEKIKECIRDNQDGTVTVRFFEKGGNGFSPVYVTVEKKIPRVLGAADAFAGNCLWAQMIERAYVASGMHLTHNQEQRRAVSADIEDVYEGLTAIWAESPEDIRQSAVATFPWLFDKQGKLQKWQPHYKQIESGTSSEFIECLLGETYKGEIVNVQQIAGQKDTVRNYPFLLSELFKNEAKDALLTGRGSNELFSHHITKKPLAADGAERTEEDLKETLEIATIKVKLGDYLNSHANTSAYSDFEKEMCTHIDAFIKQEQDSKSELYKMPYFMDVMNYFKTQARLQGRAYTLFKPRTGQYLESQDAVFQRINDALEAGKIVAGGTMEFKNSDSTGKNGETGEAGLVGTHAYSILGTEIREINGKNFKFIKVRNPWGQEVRQNYTQDGDEALHAEKMRFNNQGIFLVELSDFIARFNHIYIN